MEKGERWCVFRLFGYKIVTSFFSAWTRHLRSPGLLLQRNRPACLIDLDRHFVQRRSRRPAHNFCVVRGVECGTVTGADQQRAARVEIQWAACMGAVGIEADECAVVQVDQQTVVAVRWEGEADGAVGGDFARLYNRIGRPCCCRARPSGGGCVAAPTVGGGVRGWLCIGTEVVATE